MNDKDKTKDRLIPIILAQAEVLDHYKILFATLYQIAGLVVLDEENDQDSHEMYCEVLLDCLADPESSKSLVMANYDGPSSDAVKLAHKIKE